MNPLGQGKQGPPPGYIPGVGRGASGFVTRSDVGPAASNSQTLGGSRAAETRQAAAVLGEEDKYTYDQEDDEADRIWDQMDQRMRNRRKRRKNDTDHRGQTTEVAAQFHDLKEQLANVTEDQWSNIPEVGDNSLKFKQVRRHQEAYTPVYDSLLEQRSGLNNDTSNFQTNVPSPSQESSSTLVGLSAARGTVLGMSLDRTSKNVAGEQSSIDSSGYLTSLASHSNSYNTQNIADLTKARLLLKSVRETNPRHGPGWIASARVEEAAGNLWQARKLIQQATDSAVQSVDVWLEAARLHRPEDAKRILATGVRKLPTAVELFLKASELESEPKRKQSVLRKGIEANPTSVKLWKAAVELESIDEAKLLLAAAVEKLPHEVELWLALAKLETYKNAQRVLNNARKSLPTDRSVWIAAAKLEESQSKPVAVIEQIVKRAIHTLKKQGARISRSQWLEEAEAAEASGAPSTGAAIVKHIADMGIEEEDKLRTWSEDAKGCMSRGCAEVARALLRLAIQAFPLKRVLWLQSIQLEEKFGDFHSLNTVLAEATEKVPRLEIFWLMRAKHQWKKGNIEGARNILSLAFGTNPSSEGVWLAAARIEQESGEIERARALLERARKEAPSARVFMKFALLERDNGSVQLALELVDDGIQLYPNYEKFYLIGIQISSVLMETDADILLRARKYYKVGIDRCPSCYSLWILASRLEETAPGLKGVAVKSSGTSRARSMLEVARLKLPGNDMIWLESVHLEQRSGNSEAAQALLARALQACPKSGALLATNIHLATRVQRKSRASDAINRAPEDPSVIAAVAWLFASEKKIAKARKWFERAVDLNADIGDSWGNFYAFELKNGSTESQNDILQRCAKAHPKHGRLWPAIMKDKHWKGGLNENDRDIELALKTIRTHLKRVGSI